MMTKRIDKPMTNSEIYEHQRKEAEWRKTPIGDAFSRFKGAYSRAWIADTESDYPDARLREIWASADKAEETFRKVLAELEAKARAYGVTEDGKNG